VEGNAAQGQFSEVDIGGLPSCQKTARCAAYFEAVAVVTGPEWNLSIGIDDTVHRIFYKTEVVTAQMPFVKQQTGNGIHRKRDEGGEIRWARKIDPGCLEFSL